MREQFYCGAGKEKITPSAKLIPYMLGLGRAVFEGVNDDLYVRAILFQCGKDRALIVSFDLDKAPYPEEWTALLSQAVGVPQEAILFFGIHTHTAPLTGYRPFEPIHDITKKPIEVQQAVKEYEEFIKEQMLKAAEKAAEELRPGRLGYGMGESYINVNRCGTYEMKGANGEPCVICETGVNYHGPVSRDAFVMKVEDLQGKPIAFVMNYAVHCVAMFQNKSMTGKSWISSDIGGNVSQYMEENYPGAVAVWSSGAAGDVNPILMTLTSYPDPKTAEPVLKPVLSVEASRAFLSMMAGRHFADLNKIAEGIQCLEEEASIRTSIDWAVIPGSDDILEKEDYAISEVPYKIRLHLVCIGDAAFIGANGELYTSLGEAIKAASPMKYTAVINHEASLLLDNPGYIMDDATVALCREADIVKLPHTGYRGTPGCLEKELVACTKRMFQTKLQIALVGNWHVHGRDFAGKLAAMPGCRISVVCGQRPEWAEELNCRFEPDYDALLRSPDVDGIILASSTADHEEMIIKAAQAGKHVFVEKALAVSNEAAYAIRDAVKKSGIHFVMSDPAMKGPQMFAKRMIEEGRLGQITNVRMRTVHSSAFEGTMHQQFYEKEQSGGGAVIDMGCKAVHVLYQLLGRPSSVCSMFHSYTEEGNSKGIEENAVMIYSFPNGAIGIAETGWYSPKYQLSMDVYGTEGCICQRDDQVYYRLGSGQWKQLAPEEIPPAMDYPLNYWIDNIRNDRPEEKYDIDEAVCLTEMMTAAYASAGKAVDL